MHRNPFDEEDIARKYLSTNVQKTNIYPWDIHPFSGRVLDIGCANGNTLEYLAKLPINVDLVGIEPSNSLIKEANKGDKYIIIRAYAEQMPFNNSSFDHAYSRYAVKWFMDISKSFKEVHRVLKPNSLFLIADTGFNEFRDFYNILADGVNKIFGKNTSDSIYALCNRTRFTLNDVTALASYTGFEIISQIEIYDCEIFTEFEEFDKKWFTAFGGVKDFANILGLSIPETRNMAQDILFQYFRGAELTFRHHNYLITLKK